MNSNWQLYHWHFEVSGKCTLRCPRCPRNEQNRVPWFNKELDLAFFQRTLTPEILTNHVQRITMCGDIGDPIYASQYIEIIDYIKSINPRIHVFTITNGSYRSTEWWHKLAQVSNEYDTVSFSIDGYDNASNNLYRINSDWDSIMAGMDVMTQHSSAFVYWATIVFNFNQDHLDTIKQLAIDRGCDGLQITHSTKFGSKYGDSYGGQQDSLEPRQEFVSPTHRYQRYFHNLSGRQPLNQEYLNTNRRLYNQVKQQHNSVITPMCQIGNRGLYVSADGVLHPCSWVSFPYVSMATDRKVIWFQDSFHQQHRDRLNLQKRSLSDVMNDQIWDKLFRSFDCENRAWVECEQKCHKDLVDENYAVGWLTN
jgi:MoaA/NifB/PqqE/SkfB family radical SAM enzyme